MHGQQNIKIRKTQFMISSNSYMFCHWRAIITKSMNTKDHEFNTERVQCVIRCAHRIPKDSSAKTHRSW